MVFCQVALRQACEGEGIPDTWDEILVVQGLDISRLQVSSGADMPGELLAFGSSRSRFALGVSGWAHEDAKGLVGFCRRSLVDLYCVSLGILDLDGDFIAWGWSKLGLAVTRDTAPCQVVETLGKFELASCSMEQFCPPLGRTRE